MRSIFERLARRQQEAAERARDQATSAELEWRVFARWGAAERALTRGCSTYTCEPILISNVYNYFRGKLENQLAIGVLAVGGTAVVVG